MLMSLAPVRMALGEAGVVAIFIENFLDEDQPVINGDGLQTRDFVYVGDVVAANLLAIEYNQSGTFNIGTGKETDILTIYQKLQEIIGSTERAEARPGQARRAAPQRLG